MTAAEIRVDYQQLERIAARFRNASSTSAEITNRLMRTADLLKSEGWQGRGADSFQHEFGDTVLPALSRLTLSFEQSASVIQQITSLMQAAEDEASMPFREQFSVMAFASSLSDAGGDEPFSEKDSFQGITATDISTNRPLSQEEKDWIDEILDLPWWVDLPLGVLVVGDVLDLAREQILKRIKGQEPDALVTSLAALGLAAEAGWLVPTPGLEDVPNAALATLKTIAKQLPQGEARELLAEIVEKSIKNPEDMARLGKITTALAENADLFPKLIDNPRALVAVLHGGPETVELLAKHGDTAIAAAERLGEHAPSFVKFYDDLAHVPGADNLLKDMAAGGTTSFGALGELYYFQSIKSELRSVGLVDDYGRKAADGILKDGTVIDVKNWDFSAVSYQNERYINSQLDKLTKQVELRRSQYPDAPGIRYVFTTDNMSDIPQPIRDRLRALNVDVEIMPSGR